VSSAPVPPVLKFAEPVKSDPKTWSFAAGESYKFPDRFLQKCRELARARQETVDAQSQLVHVIRNLISIADNCHDATAAMAEVPDAAPSAVAAEATATAEAREAESAAAGEELEKVVPSTESAVDRDSTEAVLLASVRRSVTGLLEDLGVVSVELLGTTYETVMIDGRKIEDPFEILEARQTGPKRSLPVVEVVSPLWVRREQDRISIVRAGKVFC
jgi:hypothetical protein